jgi:hypothetical protein
MIITIKISYTYSDYLHITLNFYRDINTGRSNLKLVYMQNLISKYKIQKNIGLHSLQMLYSISILYHGRLHVQMMHDHTFRILHAAFHNKFY